MWSKCSLVVALGMIALVLCGAVPLVDVLTVETRQTVVSTTLNLEFYNAYASRGNIQRCIVSDVRGSVLIDFTSEVDKQGRGRQDVPINVSSYASGSYYAVVSCENETLTLPFAVLR